jgi:outer membrane protein OmpA-like peptidoglycan-associated protein
MRTLLTTLGGALIAALLFAPGQARAGDHDMILTLEAGAGVAPNAPYDDRFSVGGQGGVGLYWAFAPQLAIGKRLDIAVLPEDEEGIDGNYGYGSLMAAVRVRPFAGRFDPRRGTGLFIDGGIGPAIAEGHVRLAFAAALGYTFEAGSLGIGPQIRYTQVVERERFNGADARILTGGIVFTFLDERPSSAYAWRTIDLGDPEATADAKVEEPPPPDAELTVFVDDSLLVDERVFFEFDRAELRPRGQTVLDHVIELYGETGDSWVRLRIQGHADERGPATYNVGLSRRRAEAVREYLTSHGMRTDLLDVEAYGESRPLIEDASTEQEYQMNRRVQFDVVREGAL